MDANQQWCKELEDGCLLDGNINVAKFFARCVADPSKAASIRLWLPRLKLNEAYED